MILKNLLDETFHRRNVLIKNSNCKPLLPQLANFKGKTLALKTTLANFTKKDYIYLQAPDESNPLYRS